MGLFSLHQRHTLRRLLRSPLFTVLTLLTLAIGIGANTAIFSVIEGVLIKPLPYPEPDRLVAVWHTAPGLSIPQLPNAPSNWFTYREESRTFQDFGIWRGDTASVTGLAEPEEVTILTMTDGVLEILGVQPALGRSFNIRDTAPGAPDTVILANGYWRRKFAADASVIGRKLMIDSKPREIIGVLPADFRFQNRKPALILPFQFDRAKTTLGNFSYQGVARLKPGFTLEQASADVARMLPIVNSKFRAPTGITTKMFEEARIAPQLKWLKDDVVGDSGKTLWVLMGTIGIVLLIACANVANLLLVRAEGRQHELAIRAALGAGWGRIAADLLLESIGLGLAGGALGVGLAYGAQRLLVALAPVGLPRLDEITIDPWVLLFALAVSLLSSVLFGLIPVVKYAGPALMGALRQGGRALSHSRERHRARSVLVVVQVALALVLLIGSGLMIRTFQAMRKVQPGFTRPEEVQTFRISIPSGQVKEPAQVLRAEEEIQKRIAAIPGVRSVSFASGITMDGNNSFDPIFPEDRPYAPGQLPPVRRFKFMAPGFLATVGNPLLAGRDFTWTDNYDVRPVAIITENLAREYWGSPAAALGKRIHERPDGTWREIVGVCGNERDDGVDKKAPTTVYWPIMTKDFWGNGLTARRWVSFAVRSERTGREGFVKEIGQAVWSVNPNLPLATVGTLEDIYSKSMARTSFTLVLLGIASAMAMLLGVVGIYGVISYSVSQRTREIGIRIALGAPRQDVTGMFVRHGLVLAAIGVAFGLATAAAITRLMSSLLFNVNAIDPATYAGVSVTLAAAAALASYLPSRRASGVDPVEALRSE